MNRRQPAVPLLIGDLLNSSVEELTDKDTLIKREYITKSGARVFRTLVAGVMMDRIPLKSGEKPLYKLRISDPTGGIDILVGQYDPELLPLVEEMDCPSFVTLIGKVRTHTDMDGNESITIKPESLSVCTREERDHWLLCSVRDILARKWMMQGRGPLPNRWSIPSEPEDPRGGEEVTEYIDTIIMDTLRTVDKTFFSKALEMARNEKVTGKEDPDDYDKELEEDVLQIIRSMDKGDGARWDKMVEYIEENRLSRDVIEEVISDLLDRGVLYEPVLGYLKTI